ncbi:hypothetical protein KAS14_01930, partial [Candidatus Bathyarchaeota archaeon]|nr:hypothetical protein [Candidatus Bathyarchaeota archaeon]
MNVALKQKIFSNLQKLSKHKVPIIIITLASLTMLIKLGNNFIGHWDHILPPFNPQLSIEMDTYVWDFHLLGGKYFAYQAHLVYHAIVYVFNFVFSVEMANTIVFCLLFLVSGVSMYMFVLRTLTLTEKTKKAVALIASLLYMFNPYLIFRFDIEPLTLFTIAFLPLELLLAREAVLSTSNSLGKKIMYCSMASLVTVLMTSGMGVIQSGLATVFFLGLYLFFLAVQKRKLKSFFVVFIFLFTFSILVNIWWVAPNLIHGTIQTALNRGRVYVIDSLASLQSAKEFTSYFNVIRGMAYPFPPETSSGTALVVRYPGAPIYNTGLFIFISILTPIIGAFSLLSKRARKHSEIFVFILILLFFIPIFFTGLNSPFGFLVQWLVENMPLFVFRRPVTFMFLLHFIYAYIFSLGIFSIYELIKKRRNAIRLPLYSAIIYILLL